MSWGRVVCFALLTQNKLFGDIFNKSKWSIFTKQRRKKCTLYPIAQWLGLLPRVGKTWVQLLTDLEQEFELNADLFTFEKSVIATGDRALWS